MCRVNQRKKKTAKKHLNRGFLSWATEHIRPGITFDHANDDEYWEAHGGKPDFGDVGKWGDYVKNNATFWIKFRFDF